MKAPNVWAQIDARLAKHEVEIERAKQIAQSTGHAYVKAHDSGVWSARRAARFSGGASTMHERSADALIAAMKLNAQQFKRTPKKKPEART